MNYIIWYMFYTKFWGENLQDEEKILLYTTCFTILHNLFHKRLWNKDV